MCRIRGEGKRRKEGMAPALKEDVSLILEEGEVGMSGG